MTAPAGAVVRIFVDLAARVAVDDVIQTQSGRRYLVCSVREQQRGKHAGRQHLGCVVMAADQPMPDGARTHRIRWYRRNRRRR